MPKGLQIAPTVGVALGWRGEIVRILAILAVDSKRRDANGPVRAARPIAEMILAAAMQDKIFLSMVAKQDRQAAANRLYKIARLMIQGGVKPVNKPSTAARKKGDRRALRNTAGRDRVYTGIVTNPHQK